LDRCPWAKTEQYVQYHDTEWGVPVHDDRLLFEFLILEGAQAGLSWETILNKRENYRAAFDFFDPALIGKYGPNRRKSLLSDAGIVRNRLKIEAAIQNAKMFLSVQDEFGTVDECSVWRCENHYLESHCPCRWRNRTGPAEQGWLRNVGWPTCCASASSIRKARGLRNERAMAANSAFVT
jgi:3-methyladenine DNA glycosylase Tag